MLDAAHLIAWAAAGEDSWGGWERPARGRTVCDPIQRICSYISNPAQTKGEEAVRTHIL